MKDLSKLEKELEQLRGDICIALSALENIFNGLTSEGVPKNKKLREMADLAAKVLVEL